MTSTTIMTFVLLLHSKASVHDPELKDWGKYLFESLIGSKPIVESIFAIFAEAPEVGLIAAQHFEPVRKNLGWGENFEICEGLAARLGIDLKPNGILDFPSGSMLWARTAALRPFFDAGLVLGDFSRITSGGKSTARWPTLSNASSSSQPKALASRGSRSLSLTFLRGRTRSNGFRIQRNCTNLSQGRGEFSLPMASGWAQVSPYRGTRLISPRPASQAKKRMRPVIGVRP